MRILAVDTGTGTQDILLFDTTQLVENSVKMVVPSPTMRVAARIKEATTRRSSILFTGVTMGGGPCRWALERHLAAGLDASATPDAARTFDDDLAEVERLGVRIVGEDEAKRMTGAENIVMRDLDLPALRHLLATMGAGSDIDGLALGALDHGAAPPGVSDRLFRFEHVRHVVEQQNDLLAFAYRPEELPDYLTRAHALLSSTNDAAPPVFLDTAPAAALGALQDPFAASAEELLIVNLGNSHTLGFHLRGTHIYSLFEHHTGLINRDQIESMLEGLLAGTLEHEEVFQGNGHGVYYAERHTDGDPPTVVTGPQRDKLSAGRLTPHQAVPHGDMMLTGCFGLIQAFAAKHPQYRAAIDAALNRKP